MIAEFSLVPLGKGDSLAKRIAEVIDIVDKSGLPYRLTAMGTIVEGEWDDVFALIKECHLKMRRQASRILTRISIDDRQKSEDRMDRKIEEIEEILGRRIKK